MGRSVRDGGRRVKKIAFGVPEGLYRRLKSLVEEELMFLSLSDAVRQLLFNSLSRGLRFRRGEARTSSPKTLSFRLPAALYDGLCDLVEQGVFETKSSAVRAILAKFLSETVWDRGDSDQPR